MACLLMGPASGQESTGAGHVSAAGSAYFVAPDGSDDALGDAGHPFASLERARQAMRGGLVNRVYMADGVYELRTTVRLERQDSGLAILAAPGALPVLSGKTADLSTLIELDGAHGVTIEGIGLERSDPRGAALVLSGAHGARIMRARIHDVGTAILLSGSSGNQVMQSTIERAAASGIEVKDGSYGNLFEGNRIRDIGAPAQEGGALFLHGAHANRITGNLIENTAGSGINVANWDATTINIGTVIAGNTIRNTSTRSRDSGAIYVLGRSHADTGMLIANNVVDGTGHGGDAHTVGIYLDDSTSGVRVIGNFVQNIGTHALQVHGGDDCDIRGNVFDLGETATSAVLFQAAPADTNPSNTMRGNVVQGNVIIARGVGQTAYSFLDGGTPDITANVYFGPMKDLLSGGPMVDARPLFGGPDQVLGPMAGTGFMSYGAAYGDALPTMLPASRQVGAPPDPPPTSRDQR